MTKKLWERHQADEFTAVNEYKEGVCLGCMKVDRAAATIADICGDCAGKKVVSHFWQRYVTNITVYVSFVASTSSTLSR